MIADPWLQRWLPRIAEGTGNAPVLEIGCGSGADTAVLIQAGCRVVAFDLSPEAVSEARRAAPAATITVQSVEQPFPLEGAGIGVVVASLSLHYFSWAQTLSVVARIQSTLRPGGLFLCRLNSTQDKNYGAVGHPEVEPGLYMVGGQAKRFFAEADVASLFHVGWRVLSCQHVESLKYGAPKYLWEVAAERDAQPVVQPGQGALPPRAG